MGELSMGVGSEGAHIVKTFSCYFLGAQVRVRYERSGDEEAIWIANVVLDGRVRSIDGAAALQTPCAQSDVTRSVLRGLEWVRKSDASL
ncbi:hypothetical protein CA260_18790 [Dyella jiangningensis]|uniref:Uncharacterized protein n=1 Tax=Dyella jiangningensis TaxID=1379159 RepID=A0A328P3V6_9GAMM|nr:hypothetical protein CA260_18790 [Dyella jiangningensis]